MYSCIHFFRGWDVGGVFSGVVVFLLSGSRTEYGLGL